MVRHLKFYRIGAFKANCCERDSTQLVKKMLGRNIPSAYFFTPHPGWLRKLKDVLDLQSKNYSFSVVQTMQENAGTLVDP